MAKKVQVKVTDDQNKETTFKTKTLTKLFNKVPKGTHYKVHIQENNFGEQFVGDYVTKSPPNEPEEPDQECPAGQHWDEALGKCVDDVVTPPPNQPPIVNVQSPIGVVQHNDVTMTAQVSDPDGRVEDTKWTQLSGTPVTLTVIEDGVYSASFHADAPGQYVFKLEVFDNLGSSTSREVVVNVSATPPPPPPTCPPGQHMENGVCVPDTPPPPPPPAGNEIFNSKRDTKLHDGRVRTITREGDISPGKLGVECRASGDPEIQVHADNTFSLVSGSGGVENFSTKLRSRHNEGGDCEHRFGGIGCHIDNSQIGMKIEKCHNIHESGTEKSHGVNINDGNYHTLEFQVKDVSGGIEQIAWVDGTEKLKRTKTSPPAYYTDKASFDRQSYLWLRLNNSDHGRIYVYALNYNSKLKVVFKLEPSNNAIRFKEVILTAV